MALLKPCDHGMVISTPEWFFIGPLIFLGLELCHSLALLRLVGGVVGIVGQFQAVIIESSFLDYHKHFGIVESFHDHLSHIFVEVLMFNGAHLFCLKIEDVNFTFRNVHDDYLAFVKHDEPVDDVRILMLPKDVTIGVHMNDTLSLTWFDHLRIHVGIVVSCRKTEDLR